MTSEAGRAWDTDLPLIVEALRANGVSGTAVAWDAQDAEWDGFDLAVIRSTWDYAERIDEYLAWADTTARLTRLWNPAPVVRWSSDKRYLTDLAEQGVAVVPTRFIEPGSSYGEEDFPGTGAVVVKPVVSAGALDTARYEPDQRADAERHVRMLLDQGRAVMVQPYLRLVEEGERALVFISGTFSHAIRKGPVLTESGVVDNGRVPHPDVTPYQPTDDEISVALAALAAVPAPEIPLFARVDLVLDERRRPVVMELELIEPNLFLGDYPKGLKRLVDAVTAKARMAGARPEQVE
ncbi:ATP-grasp domain-containing protein [Streptomyces sp. NBC_01268]|uniref:ATP-grasp domain-containing protein n=1 Tax=Streptomyces sp. NBC_01268 TaxID=2903806 RepID=UPI002E3478C4|nr:hypothetical protein [Streptomyces sp. NBC_01268]